VKTFVLFFCLAISGFAQGTKSSPASAPSEKIDPVALIREILGTAPKTPRELMGSLRIRTPDADPREVPIKWMVRPFENQWQDIYQTPDKGPISQEILTVVHRAGMPNRHSFQSTDFPEHHRQSRGHPEQVIPQEANTVWIPGH